MLFIFFNKFKLWLSSPKPKPKGERKKDSVNMLNPYIQKCHSVGINLGLSTHTHRVSLIIHNLCCVVYVGIWKVKKVCHVAHWKEWELQILLIFYSYHIMSRIIPSLFLSFITYKNPPLPLSSTSYPILSYSSSLTYVLHLFSSTSLTKSKVTTKSVQL